MGLSLEQTIPLAARPRHYDALETFEADGKVLFLVTMRKKGPVYYLFRYTYKALNWLLGVMFTAGLLREPVLVKNPLPFEFSGIFDDEEKALGCVTWLLAEAAKRKVRVGVSIGPLTVNRAFPFEPVRWGGLTNPGAWLFKRERAPLTLYRLVAESEWAAKGAELDDWRAGRRQTAETERLRECVAEVLRLAEWRRQIECRLCRLEQAKGDACATGRGAA